MAEPLERPRGPSTAARETRMMAGMVTDQGFRVLPGPPVEVVAWGPKPTQAMEQGVLGLVSTFADVSGSVTTRPLTVSIEPDGSGRLLDAIVEEVCSAVSVLGVVPVSVALEEGDTGGLSGILDVVRLGDVVRTGELPDRVSVDGPTPDPSGGSWTCRLRIEASS